MAKKKSAKSAKSTADPFVANDPVAAEQETAPQHTSLKKATKKLQKDFDKRLKNAVKQIRKDAEQKIKDVVKAAERQLEEDSERLVGDALTTIVAYYQQPTTTSGAKSRGGKKKNKGNANREAAQDGSDDAEMDGAPIGGGTNSADQPDATPRGRRGAAARSGQSERPSEALANTPRPRGRKQGTAVAKPAARRVGRTATSAPPAASTDGAARRRPGRPRRAPGADGGSASDAAGSPS